MIHLTRQQQTLLCSVLLLILTGLAVKAWRAAHPAPPTSSASAQVP